MLQTLFVIPLRIGDVPLFGFGWLLAAWAVVCAGGFAWAIRRVGFNAEVRGYLPVALIVGLAIYLLPFLFPKGLPIRGYGVMMLVGVVSGVGLAIYRARQFGFHPELILTLAFWMFLTGIVGARLFYVVEYWDDFRRNHPDLGNRIVAILNISEGGLVVYGSFIAVMIAVAVFVRKYRLPGLALADLIAPCMFLGLAFGRVGCMLNGCCFAGVCEVPWSVQFPWGSPPHERQAALGLIDLHGFKFDGQPADPPVISHVVPGSAAENAGFVRGDRIRAIGGAVREYVDGGTQQWVTFRREVATIEEARAALLRAHGAGARIAVEATPSGESAQRVKSAEWELAASPPSLAVHPVQIYSAIDALLICLFLIAYTPYRRSDGAVIGAALLVYAIARFFEEIIRSDEPNIWKTNLTISQNISLLVFAAGVVIWAHILTRPPSFAFPRAAE